MELGVLGLPDGKDEYYMTCFDLDIIAGSAPEGVLNPFSQQDPQTATVTNFKSHTIYTTNPLLTSGIASFLSQLTVSK